MNVCTQRSCLLTERFACSRVFSDVGAEHTLCLCKVTLDSLLDALVLAYNSRKACVKPVNGGFLRESLIAGGFCTI